MTQKKPFTKTQDAKAQDAPPAQVRLLVRARVAGFRRAGRAWPAEPVMVAASEFTAEQIARLNAEPMLVVEEL